MAQLQRAGELHMRLTAKQHLQRLFPWRGIAALHVAGMLAIFCGYWAALSVGWSQQASLLIAAALIGGVLMHAVFTSAWPVLFMGLVWAVLAVLGLRPEMYVAAFVAMSAAAATLIVHFSTYRRR
jgi:hypothetical protein